MSRFEDTLRRDLRQIADRATPSSDAWASIRQRIADQQPIHETEVIMLTDNTIRTRRWPLVAAAAAVVALIVGVVAAVSRGDDAPAPADPPAPTVAPEPEAGAPVEPPVSEPTSLADLADGDPMPPGPYTSDKLGVPVTFEVPAGTDWMLRFKSAYSFDIGTNSSFVAMTRLGSFYDAEEAVDPDMRAQGSIPADDIDGFIVANDLIVEDSRDATIGGRPASFRQVRLPDGAGEGLCSPAQQPCIQMGRHSADLQIAPVINIGGNGGTQSQSFWVVDMDGYEPFGIYIWTSDPDGPQAWLDEVAPLLESITFGEPAPAVEGGTARLPERVTVTADMLVTQTGERDLDNPWPIERTGTIVGDINGTFSGTGMSSPNGAEVTLDWVMDVTIDGFGTGTLTLRSDESWPGDVARSAVDHVIGGTGDFEGVTGFGTTTHTDDGDVFTATIELQLVPPAN